MINTILTSLFLVPIAAYLLLGSKLNKRLAMGTLKKLTTVIPLLAVLLSIVAAFAVAQTGLVESAALVWDGLGFSIRLDALTLIMYGMVSLIGMIVLRFSYNYLEGDANHSKFIGGLMQTIGLVQLLILSGNLVVLFVAWVATSLALNKLIVFYPNRIKAKKAARKKFFVARLGDLSMLAAFTLIYFEFGTGNLNLIFQDLQQLTAASFELEIIATLLVLTAGLKSAQIPFHSWLIDVMEAPTPVSALLHAGLLNAGPFLMIRFSYLLDVVTVAPAVLFTMGAVTALIGAIICTTQPQVKTALAYSSVAHMGFTLMASGLGLYAASLLHLVAHSFYKAHAFLSSGSLIEKMRTQAVPTFKRKGSVVRILIGIGLAVSMYALIAMLWGVNLQSEFQLLIIGGIILTGIIRLLVNTVDATNYFSTILKAIGITAVVLMSFFGLEEMMRLALGSQIPLLTEPTVTMQLLAGGMLLTFFLTVCIPLVFINIQSSNLYKKLEIHARNGFYLTNMVDKYSKSTK